eukprot:378699_1
MFMVTGSSMIHILFISLLLFYVKSQSIICTDDECICGDDQRCKETVINCNSTESCHVECNGLIESCKGSTINCNSAQNCHIICNGRDSCENAKINCNSA